MTIQLRHPIYTPGQEPVFIPPPRSGSAGAPKLAPRRRCATCTTWLSVYRDPKETRCNACRIRHAALRDRSGR